MLLSPACLSRSSRGHRRLRRKTAHPGRSRDRIGRQEGLLPGARVVGAAGTRRNEMALRLSYAGVDEKRFETVDGVGAALDLLAARHAGSVYVLPTYTALKEVRGAVAGWEVVDA